MKGMLKKFNKKDFSFIFAKNKKMKSQAMNSSEQKMVHQSKRMFWQICIKLGLTQVTNQTF